MSHQQVITCDCGGELSRPLPVHCPHCGKLLTSVKHSRLPLVKGLLVIGATFAVLAGFLWFLLQVM